MQPTGQPEQAELRSRVRSANSWPEICSIAGSLVACRLRQGRERISSSASRLAGVPRSWYFFIMPLAVTLSYTRENRSL